MAVQDPLPPDSQSRPRVFVGPTEVTDAPTLEEIYRLRARVWRQMGLARDGAFPNGMWCDPLDANCRHWIVIAPDGSVAAAGRISIHKTLSDVHQAEEYLRYSLDPTGPVAAPDRVVVCPSFQGQGLGRRILDVQDAAAREGGARIAVRQASPDMVRLLRHRGWRLLGPASPDPRFPGVAFTVVVLDLAADRKTCDDRQNTATARATATHPANPETTSRWIQ